METRQSLINFVYSLEARSIRLVLRRNRLNAGASQRLLTAAERTYINANREALKELLQDCRTAAPVAAESSFLEKELLCSGAATIDTTGSEHSQTPSSPPAAAIVHELRAARARAERDAYIKQHDPDTWRVLHFNDPDEILRRNNEATAAMNSPYQPPIHNW